MRHIKLLIMPLTTSLAAEPELTQCGTPGCDCATQPDDLSLEKFRDMVLGNQGSDFGQLIAQFAENYHNAHPELTRAEVALDLISGLFDGLAPEPEQDANPDRDYDEKNATDQWVEYKEWDDDQIVLFSTAELQNILESTMLAYEGKHVHSFLKSVELLDDEAMIELEPSNHNELIDEVKGAMNVLERTYNSTLEDTGLDDATRAVQLGAIALSQVYGYSGYVVFTAMVNVLAKVEMNNHG